MCSRFVESGSSVKPYPDGTGIGSSRSGASGFAALDTTSVNNDRPTSPPANRRKDAASLQHREQESEGGDSDREDRWQGQHKHGGDGDEQADVRYR